MSGAKYHVVSFCCEQCKTIHTNGHGEQYQINSFHCSALGLACAPAAGLVSLSTELLDRYVESEIQLREVMLIARARPAGSKERERRDRLRGEVLAAMCGAKA